MEDLTRDKQLWEACRTGNSQARRDFALLYLPLLARFLGNKVDVEAVEEITSQTFERLFGGVLLRYEARSRLSTFVLGVAYQCLREHICEASARRGHVDASEVSLAALWPTPSQVVAQDERERRFLAALRLIPSDHQTLLELYYWDGRTTAEIAEIVGVPVGTVRTRLDRARELLRGKLKDANFDPSTWIRLER